jgi:hypothetical protein
MQPVTEIYIAAIFLKVSGHLNYDPREYDTYQNKVLWFTDYCHNVCRVATCGLGPFFLCYCDEIKC